MVKVHFDQDDNLDLVTSIIKVIREQQNRSSTQTSLPSEESKKSAICEKCGKDLYQISRTPEKTIQYSLKFHDGIFCYDCQQILKKEREA